jgi:hypothetical protein
MPVWACMLIPIVRPIDLNLCTESTSQCLPSDTNPILLSWSISPESAGADAPVTFASPHVGPRPAGVGSSHPVGVANAPPPVLQLTVSRILSDIKRTSLRILEALPMCSAALTCSPDGPGSAQDGHKGEQTGIGRGGMTFRGRVPYRGPTRPRGDRAGGAHTRAPAGACAHQPPMCEIWGKFTMAEEQRNGTSSVPRSQSDAAEGSRDFVAQAQQRPAHRHPPFGMSIG